jgi:hypothetical protein
MFFGFFPSYAPLHLANETNTPHFCPVLEAFSCRPTEDGKSCAHFLKQFHVFHQGKGKEKENRADANGEFVNGCPK